MTDFIIWTDKHVEFCERNGEKALEPVANELMSALRIFLERTEEYSFYRADKTKEELQYLLCAMAFDYLELHYGMMEYPRIPVNYDGYRWRYLANRETKRGRINVGRQVCFPLNDGVPYEHRVYWMKGFGGRNMMSQNEIRACWSLLDEEISCEKEWMMTALQRGFIKRMEDGKFSITVPVFSKKQMEGFEKIVEETFGVLAPEYVKCVERFVKGYQTLFPEHLHDDVKRMCRNMIFSFYEVVMKMGRQEGIMSELNSEWICDVLRERS